jgi:hypothetical protein
MYTVFLIFAILYLYGLYNFFIYKPKYDLSDKDLFLFFISIFSIVITVFFVLFFIIKIFP